MKKLQIKLVRLLLLTSTVPLVVLALIAGILLHVLAMQEARQKLDDRLTIGKAAYERSLDELKYDVRDMNRRVYTLLEEDQIELLRNELESLCRKRELDFFEVSDHWGTVIVSAGRMREGADVSTDPFVIRALAGKAVVSVQKISLETLEALGLKDKAVTGADHAGIFVKAGVPLINQNEIIVGTMTAGYLFNAGGGKVIDAVSTATGSAALITMDGRLLCSTLEGQTETGTVLKAGSSRKVGVVTENFSGVDYVLRYAGLMGPSGISEGHLGIGIPAQDVFASRDSILRLFAVAVVLSIVLSFFFGMIKGGNVVHSVLKLRKGIEAFGKGNFEYRVEINSEDELQELADFLNATVSQLRVTRQELESCSRNVERLEDTISRNALELEQAQKKIISFERMAAIGRMAAALSHELRNVFSEINAGAQALKAGLKSKGRQADRGAVEEIEHGLKKVSEILERVLFFSYQQKPVFSMVDLNYVLDQLLERNRDLIAKGDVTVIKNFDPDLPEVEADGPQIREALNNLVVNAIQSMLEVSGGKLTLSTENNGASVQVVISDTGCGMAEGILANLFTPFVTTKRNGLGIGLCVSQSIIEAHSGTVQAASRPGRGSSFTVIIPISHRQADNRKEGEHVQGREYSGS